MEFITWFNTTFVLLCFNNIIAYIISIFFFKKSLTIKINYIENLTEVRINKKSMFYHIYDYAGIISAIITSLILATWLFLGKK